VLSIDCCYYGVVVGRSESGAVIVIGLLIGIFFVMNKSIVVGLIQFCVSVRLCSLLPGRPRIF
jgi:hypothetical protein